MIKSERSRENMGYSIMIEYELLRNEIALRDPPCVPLFI